MQIKVPTSNRYWSSVPPSRSTADFCCNWSWRIKGNQGLPFQRFWLASMHLQAKFSWILFRPETKRWGVRHFMFFICLIDDSATIRCQVFIKKDLPWLGACRVWGGRVEVRLFDIFQFSSCTIQGFYFVANRFDDDCLAALCFKFEGNFDVLRATGTSSTPASFNTTSLVEVYASSGMLWISYEFFYVYCSKGSCRLYNSAFSSCCLSILFMAELSSLVAFFSSFFANASVRVANSACCFLNCGFQLQYIIADFLVFEQDVVNRNLNVHKHLPEFKVARFFWDLHSFWCTVFVHSHCLIGVFRSCQFLVCRSMFSSFMFFTFSGNWWGPIPNTCARVNDY